VTFFHYFFGWLYSTVNENWGSSLYFFLKWEWWKFFILILETRMAAFLKFFWDENGEIVLYTFLKMKMVTFVHSFLGNTSTYHLKMRIVEVLYTFSETRMVIFFTLFFLAPYFIWRWDWWQFNIRFFKTVLHTVFNDENGSISKFFFRWEWWNSSLYLIKNENFRSFSPKNSTYFLWIWE